MPRTFRYNFDWGRHGLLISLWSTLFNSFIYISMMFKSKAEAMLFVVMRMPLLLVWIKSIEIVDLTSFKSLLIFVTWVLALAINLLELLDPIGTMICFQDSSFMLILIFGFFWLSCLWSLEFLRLFLLIVWGIHLWFW